MIFYTVGTQLPFERLTKLVDEFALSSPLPIYGQIGEGSYKPKHFEFSETLDVVDFEKKFNQASIIISHAGMGTILQSLVANKVVCICAREAKFNEHRNDHQIATVKRFSAWDNVLEVSTLLDLQQSLKVVNKTKQQSLSPWASPKLLKQLSDLIQ